MVESKPFIIAITGASGSLYGIRMIQELIKHNRTVYTLITDSAKQVIPFETGKSWEQWYSEFNQNNEYVQDIPLNNIYHKIASGSYSTEAMIISPCSMGTLGRIASGISSNLLERAADVTLKEKRSLILMARETPLNRIHIQNMLTINEAGGIIFPPTPAFYAKPQTIEELVQATVCRVLQLAGLEINNPYSWQPDEREW
ncbi:UbiX family flavin prenyltransferase [Spirochaeta cellobiosiphila]|uniref:UbiX family flavin prenyltransferase n=1 Tax=Spirochaeta cellobiosiphila TaxID=504483 RepID=UPI0004068882|nr:UbiX family flavin prenyltransferase [Spirochaeta cellobiosiphila]